MYSLQNDYHVAVPTAFNLDESLNNAATIEHILFLKSQGVSSVLVCGSTGEQHSLTLEEKLSLVAALEEEPQLKFNFELLFGVASIRLSEALCLAQAINQSTTVSGILLGTPPYILPTQTELHRYLQQVIRICNKPVILYNNPKRTGTAIELELLKVALTWPSVIGIKEAGPYPRIQEFHLPPEKKVVIYAGGELDLQQKVAYGVTRLSSILGNLYPQEISQWFTSLKRGEAEPIPCPNELQELISGSSLAFLKKAITAKEGIPMGLPRGPLG